MRPLSVPRLSRSLPRPPLSLVPPFSAPSLSSPFSVRRDFVAPPSCPRLQPSLAAPPNKTKEASLPAALFLSSPAAIPGRLFVVVRSHVWLPSFSHLQQPSWPLFYVSVSSHHWPLSFVSVSSRYWLPRHHYSSQMALRRGASPEPP